MSNRDDSPPLPPRFPPDDARAFTGDPHSAVPGRGQLAVMAVVLTAALVIAVYGVIGLVLNRDVIEEPDAGPLVGPLMAVSVCAVVLWFVLKSRSRRLFARPVAAALTAVVVGPLVGAIAYAVVRGEIFVIPVFFGRYVTGPFVLSSGLIAGLVVFSVALLERSRPR